MVSIEAPDRHGQAADVLLGFDDVSELRAGRRRIWCVARAHRESNRRWPLRIDNHTYRLPTNEGTSTLHGGPLGFDKVYWSALRQRLSLRRLWSLVMSVRMAIRDFRAQLSVRGNLSSRR